MSAENSTLLVVFFLGAALTLYVLFGGADYGAGVLELFRGRKLQAEQETLVNRVMGPVWEANHIWLIIVIVILFMGFPKVYTLTTTYLHLPLTFVLFGIVARGCAFTFRHYDAYHEVNSQRIYSRIFRFGSLWTPFWLGVAAGALILGRIDPEASTTRTLFIDPWFNIFSASIGLFTICLFTFLAAIYLIAESDTEALKNLFKKRALVMNALTVLAGLLVFVTAIYSGSDLMNSFVRSRLSQVSFVTATLLLIPLWYFVIKGSGWRARLFAGAQAVAVLIGWFGARFPVIVQLKTSQLDVFQAAAPEATLRQLAWALSFGLVLIVPALVYLLRVFRTSPGKPRGNNRV